MVKALLIVKVGNGTGSITTLPYLDQSYNVTSCDFKNRQIHEY